MTVIDHVTYQVRADQLRSPEVGEFMTALGLMEVAPDTKIEAGWEVRWFQSNEAEVAARGYDAIIHLVAADSSVPLGLSHFCITFDGENAEGYERLRQSRWLERDSGSGRIWLAGPCGLRVEVRP